MVFYGFLGRFVSGFFVIGGGDVGGEGVGYVVGGEDVVGGSLFSNVYDVV